jgi:Fe-S-cluster containining protein
MSTNERTEFGAVRTKCGCAACTANCECIPGYLIPDDLERMIPHEVYKDAESLATWAREHLRASEGALIERHYTDGRRVRMRVGTLVPAHREGLSCHWLKDGRCEIHENAPFGCAFFDCNQTKAAADVLSSQGVTAIMQAHAEQGPYAVLWRLLWEEGLQSPSLLVKREALDARWEELRQQARRH